MVALGTERPDVRHIVNQLIAEFGSRIDAETISVVSEHEFALLDRAKVTSFVEIIAWRLARTRIKELVDHPPTGGEAWRRPGLG
jgi:hypothetical protein